MGLLGASWVALGASWGALGRLGSLFRFQKLRMCAAVCHGLPWSNSSVAFRFQLLRFRGARAHHFLSFFDFFPRVRTDTRPVRTGTRLLLPFDYSEPQESTKYSHGAPLLADKGVLRSLRGVPRSAQGPRLPHKVGPRGPTRPSRDTQVAPRGSPDAAKSSQDPPRTLPRRSKKTSSVLGASQTSPKDPLGPPEDPPKDPQGLSKTPRGTYKDPL